MNDLQPNTDKKLAIEVNGMTMLRFPIQTHTIMSGENIIDVIEQYVKPYAKYGDLVFVSERVVAIAQGRAFPIKDIKPSWLARFLVRFVHKSPYGIGLGSPWTMELAIREVGAMRILFAAFCSAITKPFGMKGVFYKVVGNNINAIDGPCDYTLPPYNEYAKLGPARPHEVARQIRDKIGYETVIIDANDLGVAILGKSNEELSDDWCKAVFRDNPLGQSSERTPICIVRQQL